MRVSGIVTVGKQGTRVKEPFVTKEGVSITNMTFGAWRGKKVRGQTEFNNYFIECRAFDLQPGQKVFVDGMWDQYKDSNGNEKNIIKATVVAPLPEEADPYRNQGQRQGYNQQQSAGDYQQQPPQNNPPQHGGHSNQQANYYGGNPPPQANRQPPAGGYQQGQNPPLPPEDKLPF
ncbi:MAG: hypothetical protein VXB01_14885 [Opitutae bacterium]